MRERFLNPYTDFGFKKIFGEEINKDLLIDFLNHLITDLDSPIEDLQYLKNEHLPRFEESRRAIFDLHCRTEKGDRFIVEIQRAKQEHFRDRSIFYSTFPVQDQAERGKTWNFNLQRVYTVSLLDFSLEDSEEYKDIYLHDVQLKDQRNRVFSDKLRYIYLEMPKFNKDLEDLRTHFDKWLFVLKNMSALEDRPKELRERIFQKIFEVAEIGKLDASEYTVYQEELKIYWDLNNVVDYAREEGREEGIEIGIEKGLKKGKIETAKKLLSIGLSIDQIMEATDLTKEEIEALK
ncbi:Rpn family recombination-promoting nuclease/putative transposase [Aureibacter tunicatorum]|uniref:Transposase/invertase (TIGR01784 family) n=1 Tax=Aureibacter tunicatorum TaxID=866807 RepID=A0AAE3XU81_9BACT|nr:Rpn family recombination-promoting nuclease/putative transposase [Aureibacter tunicatorum]MDR6241789.1 putative transposase/invertase (TIGR01784 family) [Aureibacter tunicatorum]BDD07419.1 hypothetical protein AUTU_49020 [Aureibacter tunicatorum]